MSNLICYCSIATVACIWYIGFLPHQTVWGLSPVQSFDYSGMPILGNCNMSLTLKTWMMNGIATGFLNDDESLAPISP